MTTAVAAAAGESAVIKRHLRPSAGADVAAITRLCGDNVIRTFTGGDVAVVAPFARLIGLRVVYRLAER